MPAFVASVAPRCPKCQKSVYFAEKLTALGKDFHKTCFRCSNEPCNVTLIAGKYSENENLPYCNRCYLALFGPKGYGHVTGVESHVYCNGTTGGNTLHSNNNQSNVLE